MSKVKNLVVMGLLLGLVILPVKAEEELPVEIDAALLSEGMRMEDVKAELEATIDEEGLKNRDGKKAVAVLEELIEKGVPVEKAYEVVSEAVKSRERVDNIVTEENVKSLKREAAKEDLEFDAEEEELKAEDVAVAVEVLDDLIAKGVPVEKALSVLKEAISEDREPMELKELLTSDAVKEMKMDALKDKVDEDSISERMQFRHRDDEVNDKLKKIDPRIDDPTNEPINEPIEEELYPYRNN